MKNFLEYYYNLLNITVHEKDNNYYFDYNNQKYIFLNTNRNITEINSIYKINLNQQKYHKIILNRNNSAITYYNNKVYILLKLNLYEGNISYYDLNKNLITISRETEVLLRNDWINLLQKKIDYLEYQRSHLKDKYTLLDETFDYYVGMAENSISYINDTLIKETKTEADRLVISHRRIFNNSKFEFYNPLNIVIDHHSRDISEYLKFLFLKDIYDTNILNSIFENIKLSKYGYRLLLGRMLYPSFYFDLYEKIVNERINEREILKIVKRIREYEEYLSEIYRIINNKIKIPSIDWI